MPKTIDYFVSMISPWTFIGHARLRDMATAVGATITIKPLHIAKLFEGTGGTPVGMRSEQRKAYRFHEMRRWKQRFGLDEWNIAPPHFPVSDITANRMVIAEVARGEKGQPLDLAGAFMRGTWVEDRDISDEATLVELADRAGCDGAALLAAAGTDAVKQAFRDNTAEAMERGVFGCPTYIVDDEVFWGQDRLDFVEEKLGV